MYGNSVNDASRRDVYPSASGPTMGQIGGISVVSPQQNAASQSTAALPVSTVSSQGTSAFYWVALVGMLIALMWFSQRYGSEGDSFKNLKLSVYNIVVITVAAIIGLSGFKAFFTKFPVKGLSQVVLAA